MTKKELAYILRYSSPYELLVICANNRLKVLKCPFNAVVKHDVGQLSEGELIIVEEVKVTVSVITVFIVERKPYYYYHFDIVV